MGPSARPIEHIHCDRHEMLRVLLLVGLIAAVQAASTPVRRCTDDRPWPTEVRVPGCTLAPCPIVQGTTTRMGIDFRSSHGASSLRPSVRAHLETGISVDYPLPADLQNACDHLVGSSCPLSHNEDATYHFVFTIPTVYPAIRVGVELSLLDEDGRPVFCTIIDVLVQRP